MTLYAFLQHLAFGAGSHACAGIYFANHVMRIALEELLETIPNLERNTSEGVEFWGPKVGGVICVGRWGPVLVGV